MQTSFKNNLYIDDYSNLKPIPGEDKEIEYDEEFEMYAIVGQESGFYYALLDSKDELQIILDDYLLLDSKN